MQTEASPDLELAAPPALPAATAALYLDFDGTLAELAARPDQVVVPHHLRALLGALHQRLDGALAVVSGRRLEDIDRLLAPVHLAGAGLHGAELRLQRNAAVLRHRFAAIDGLAQALLRRLGGDPRLLVEDKGAAVALHFRGAPERAQDCIEAMRELAHGPELQIICGNMLVEARPAGAHKGFAVAELAAHAPFQGRLPVFVGDDTTDEDGFAAAAALGGYGIKVGPGRTGARYRCASVEAVYAWLKEGLETKGNGEADEVDEEPKAA